MKKAYVSNFSESDEELLGGGSGEESNAELDSLSKEGAAPDKGHVSKPHSASGDEETKPSETSAKPPKKGLAILSDSDEEFDPSSLNNEDTQEATNSENKDLNQSVSDLDFGSDIDIDEELERPLQSNYTEATSLEEKDHLKAVEDDIFGASDEEDLVPSPTPSARKRKNEGDQGGDTIRGPEEKKYRYATEGDPQGEREGMAHNN